uniref:G_PROTEIN_RECEP_F1_2 domain-containing protein n=1 Tax=Rhabditophanes sp. KR3021 TaxID=114890 RepID=A0AC35TVY8_9BILA
MLSISTIFNISIFCLSMISNTLVLSMYSHFKVAGKMEPGIVVIFLQTITDVLFSTTSLLFHSEVIYQNNYVSFCFVYLKDLNLSQTANAVLLFIYVNSLNFNFFTVTLTIWARYLTIASKHQMTVERPLWIFFANIIICSILTAFVVFYGIDQTADPYIISKYYKSNNITSEYITSSSTSISFKSNEWNFIIGLIPVCLYINVKYRKNMKSQFQFMSAKTRTLGNDFFKILVLQLCAPLCLHFAPILLYVAIILLKLNFVSFGSIALQLSSTVPFLNPIFFLLFLTKSRNIMKMRIRRITNFLFCGNSILDHLNSTVVSPSIVPKTFFASSKPNVSTIINKNVV